MPKKAFGICKMNAITKQQAIDDMRGMFREAAGERQPDETKGRWLDRAAAVLGLSSTRTESIEYDRGVTVRAHEYLTAERRLEQRRQRELVQAEQQVALAYARCRDNRDAFVRTLIEIVGPGHPMVRKLGGVGVVKVDGVAAPKDGEG